MLKSKFMKLAKVTALAGLAGVLPVASMAQVDFSIVRSGAQITAFTTAANTELDGIASNNAGTIQWFFDSIGAVDGIIKWDGTTLSTWATEAQLDGGSGTSASAQDITSDASDIVYASILGSSSTFRIFRVPGDDFANAVVMMATADAAQASEICVDAANNRLIVAYNDFFAAPGAPFGEGIGAVPLNATGANVSEVATEAELQAALDSIAGGAEDIDPVDVTALSDGSVLVSHGFGSSSNKAGTILKIDPLGNVSVWISGENLINALGGDGSTVDIGSVELEALNDDKVLVHISFSSNDVAFAPRFAVGSSTATNWVTLATHNDMFADTDLSALTAPLNLDGKHGNIDGNEDYYFYDQNNSTVAATALIKMSGVRAAISASVKSWDLY